MSRRIIIPRGLVNPQETTVIEIPEELSEERELIASPTCPGAIDTPTGSSSGSPGCFVPQATSSPRPLHDQTWNAPTFSSIYDSSAISYSMEPSSVFGETYDAPPRNSCTESYESERSESTDQSYGTCPSSNRTYSIPSGGGRTQTFSDRSDSQGQTYDVTCSSADRTYNVPPGRGQISDRTMSDRSDSFGRTHNVTCPSADRTYNIPPGGAQILNRTQTTSDRSDTFGRTYNISSHTDRTYTIPPGGADRSESVNQTYFICPAAERTHNIPPGGAQVLGRTFNMSSSPERTYNIPPGGAGILGRTQTIGPAPDCTFNIPRGGNRTFTVPQGNLNRTRTISASPKSTPTGNLTMTFRHSTTSIQESSGPDSGYLTDSCSIPPATSTPAQSNLTYRIPQQTYNVSDASGTQSDWGSSETSRRYNPSFDLSSNMFNPPACSTRHDDDFSRISNQSSSYYTGSSSQYTSSGATSGSGCRGGCGSTGGSRGRHLHRRHSSTFSPHDAQVSGFQPQACSTIRRNDDISRSANQFSSSCDTGSPGQYASVLATAGSSCPESLGSVGGDLDRVQNLHRGHSSAFPQGVPSRITRTISKTYVMPVPRGENAAASGSACPGRSRPSRSQTKIIKKTSKTIIKQPTPQNSTMQDSASHHSQISSCYNDTGRIRRRSDRSCPGRTQSSGLGVLGNAYLNLTRNNETPPPQINCTSLMDSSLSSPGRATSSPGRMVQRTSRTRITTTGNQSGGRSAGCDIQAELQRMEDSERFQLQEELRTFQDSRRALLGGNASFTQRERGASGSGRRHCPGSCSNT